TTSDGVVIAGNGTLAAMRRLGWTEALIIRLPWSDAETCRAYAIADNRTAELASWDSGLMAGQVQELKADGLPMDDLGFAFLNDGQHASAGADDDAQGGGGSSEATRSYRCPACGFRWRYDDGGEVVPL
ncbi:MAG: hypothetical protein ACM3W4_01120, partial [Ignavibacteriales bacterium]